MTIAAGTDWSAFNAMPRPLADNALRIVASGEPQDGIAA
jgi:hypothetical protein